MINSGDAAGNVRTASHDEWLSFCQSCPAATFFHTPHWAGVFERSFGGMYKAAPVLFSFGDGTSALLPLVVKRRFAGLLRIACSMPGGTFGGWLSPAGLSSEKEAIIGAYLDRSGNWMVRENPYQPVVMPIERYRCREDHTRIVDLEEGYEAAWKRATAAHRNAVRNALRSGVEIHEAENGRDWESYFSLYRASIYRWKQRGIFTKVKYTPRFFRELELMNPPLRKLWIARVKGTPIAGILCFYWNRHSVVWHGAALSEYFSSHPNNLLYDRAIAYAAEKGYARLDCNPSGGLTGVDKFKQYLGADPMRSREIIRRSRLAGLFDRFRRRQGGRS